MHDQCLGLFAKYWQAEQVKTRLAKSIGPNRAAELYFRFVTTLLERLNDLCDQKWLACTPTNKMGQFAEILPDSWQLEAQSDGDLGRRMKSFFARRLAAGRRRVVLLGSDSPNVPKQYIQQAFDQLISHDVVLGPTEDGGYWLIGVASRVPDIFNSIPWSTPQVFAKTIKSIRSAGLCHAELPSWYDIDEHDGLERLNHDLQRDLGREPSLDRLREYLWAQGQPS